MQSRIVQLVAFVLCGTLVVIASAFIPRINADRRDLTMYGTREVTEGTPPEYAFAIQALGAFRGLITNIAFIHAEDAKQAGRYYDAMQMADWICKLQPRFPSVWEFQSWNMAWNISVTTHTPQERWNWVYNGAKLIRDEGLKYNPHAVNLYRQLAWIFNNKMSETTDEYHMTYKRQWAWRMHLVLGSPPDPLADYRPGERVELLERGVGQDELMEAAQREKRARVERDRARFPEHPEFWEDPNVPLDFEVEAARPLAYELAKKAAYDRLMRIAQAPTTLEALYAAQPETRTLVAQLRQMGVQISDDLLDEDTYWREGREEGLAFTFFKRYRQLADPKSLLARIEKTTGQNEANAEAETLRRFDEILHVRESPPATQALLRFLQRKVLTEVYKLDPKKMAELTEIFGPMDWRTVDAQSLYWTNEGLIAGRETISKFGNDKINTARLIFFSLRNLYLRNRLVFEPYYPNIELSYINFNYDLNFVESMHRAYLTYGKILDPDPSPQGTGVGGTFRTGHQNFLTDAVIALYFAGRTREAQHYFQYLRDNYSLTSDGRFNPAFSKPLAQYVEDNLLENITGYSETRNAITGLLANAFGELSRGNLARYNELVRKALALHSKYNQGKMTSETDKMQLPPFPQYQADVLASMLQQPGLVPTVTAEKARLWAMLPPYLRRAVYDDVKDRLSVECEAMRFDFDSAFPEPAGMDEYRSSQPPPQPREQKSVETPAQQFR